MRDIGTWVQTFRRQPRIISVYVFLSPLLAVISFLLPLDITGESIAGMLVIWFLGVAVKYPDLVEAYEKTESRIELERKISMFKEILRDFENRFSEDFISFEDVERTDSLIEFAWDSITKNIYREIFLICLRETENFNIEEMEFFDYSRFAREASRIREKFNAVNPSDEDMKLAWGIYQFLCEKEKDIVLTGFEDDEFLQSECFESVFVKDYLDKEKMISELKGEKGRINDYRKTLVRLYEDAKLPSEGIYELLGKLEDEKIQKVIPDKTHFFILMNNVQKNEVGDTILREKIKDNLQEGGVEAYGIKLNVYGEERAYISGIVAVSPFDYSSKEMYDKFIYPDLLPSENDGFVSVHRSEFKGEMVLKEIYEEGSPSDEVQKSIDSLNIFTSAEKTVTYSLKEKMIDTYLSTDQLLTVLPLNLFLQDLGSDKKDILIDNNEDIKDYAGVERLTDWVSPAESTEDIAKYIQQKYFPEDSVDEWKENVEKIQAEAKEVKKAIRAEGIIEQNV